MNNDLREQHLAQITDATAVALYDRICAACETRDGGMTDPEQALVGDIAMLEQLKQQLYEDIRKRGVVEDFRNGRQHMMRENKSVTSARQLMDQQRKHLAELRLTPNSRKAQPVPVATDGFDDF